jgi:hypothetical protein
MTAVVPAIALSAPRERGRSAAAPRGPLPVAALAEVGTSPLVVRVAGIDNKGRIGDTATVRALGWHPGTRLDIRERAGLILVTANSHGVFTVTDSGHLRLPAPVRHLCRLAPGDRVLLCADPALSRIVVHPPAVVASMITQLHASILGGDVG